MSQEDRAQIEDQFRWELINRPREKAATFKPGEKGYGPEFCANEDCEAPMPEGRRIDGRRLCTECQAEHERLEARRY